MKSKTIVTGEITRGVLKELRKREISSEDAMSIKKIAEEYDISMGTVNRIKAGQYDHFIENDGGKSVEFVTYKNRIMIHPDDFINIKKKEIEDINSSPNKDNIKNILDDFDEVYVRKIDLNKILSGNIYAAWYIYDKTKVAFITDNIDDQGKFYNRIQFACVKKNKVLTPHKCIY